MNDDIFRFTRHTVVFEHMAASELRRLADRVPELAHPLTELADKLEEHADEARQFNI
jgi:hypothetical protein